MTAAPKTRRGPGAESRRRFLRLLAAGSIAALAGAAPGRARAAATAAKRRTKPAPPAGPPATLHKEIQSQKDYLGKTLQTIRAYSLPAGSPPAFVFRPLAPSKRAPHPGRAG